MSIDVNRQTVPDPEAIRAAYCARCCAEKTFEWVIAYEDGTDDPPLREACVDCGSAPGHVGSP